LATLSCAMTVLITNKASNHLHAKIKKGYQC